ncbi:PREDICTED: cleavage stimulating factor 64-like isoform X1 [Tarenaya hassleriana]|uniref:cleavage stimulating factor 64-like isoform X1 n=2 Tax=Tarenaya hassleriana TaxID=28532 RepID=UPI0008FD1FE4|nr:PREDICTED: cleavage stimulating factor 64-like isoform X1 [Tarenaya hassleriana]XP_019057669.1 PREDICTED: cleavage stimulating factor 64-like isoform X1 [Tarenaya hassleriana]XP_019057670.1 PREDICTED: cleavage stimulating factor 64-like isoform X1 [Tarenaya hassleriana]XP_019057671.1 PREDICTED: cleavage stimulating factor 64-like isoform X1 [Tarenaya hassleriana]XP_019057672.1 PREDICTED: cleavage stimulating factor 64-like isoform X1 [Tarenaya hassleriana]XP_019057673.1 PREDICTED: cleavage 
MLGTVSPQVLQMPNIVQAPERLAGSLVQETQTSDQVAVQNLLGLNPLAQRLQPLNHPPDSQFFLPQQSSKQPFLQIPQHGTLLQPAQLGLFGDQVLSLANPPVRSQIQVASSSLNEPAPFQRQAASASTSLAYSNLIVLPNNATQSSLLPRLPLSNPLSLQGEQAVSSGFGSQTNNDGSAELIGRASKMIKMEDASSNVLANRVSRIEQMLHGEKQVPQPQAYLFGDDQSALLQQVMNLTPGQVSLLTPEQRQEVMQLKQVFDPKSQR